MANEPRILRVFPRRTKATPTDDLAFVGEPPLPALYPAAYPPSVDEVHVSCTFTWDLPEARRLWSSWRRFYRRVILGGPAFDTPAGDFVPGRYLKPGYVITSRGCPNHCRWCLVPKREGPLRTLPVRDGWNVLDNNLLACPPEHLAAVLSMLNRQPRRAKLTGGLEAVRFTRSIARQILAVKPDVMFFAYDRRGDKPQLHRAFELIRELTGWRPGRMRHYVSCYVLCGFDGDEVPEAERRVRWVIDQGVRAYPMYYRDEQYSRRPREWHDLVGGVMSFGGHR